MIEINALINVTVIRCTLDAEQKRYVKYHLNQSPSSKSPKDVKICHNYFEHLTNFPSQYFAAWMVRIKASRILLGTFHAKMSSSSSLE